MSLSKASRLKKPIQYKNRAELLVLNGSKRPIPYEFHNDMKPIRYDENVVNTYFPIFVNSCQ